MNMTKEEMIAEIVEIERKQLKLRNESFRLQADLILMLGFALGVSGVLARYVSLWHGYIDAPWWHYLVPLLASMVAAGCLVLERWFRWGRP